MKICDTYQETIIIFISQIHFYIPSQTILKKIGNRYIFADKNIPPDVNLQFSEFLNFILFSFLLQLIHNFIVATANYLPIRLIMETYGNWSSRKRKKNDDRTRECTICTRVRARDHQRRDCRPCSVSSSSSLSSSGSFELGNNRVDNI